MNNNPHRELFLPRKLGNHTVYLGTNYKDNSYVWRCRYCDYIQKLTKHELLQLKADILRLWDGNRKDIADFRQKLINIVDKQIEEFTTG